MNYNPHPARENADSAVMLAPHSSDNRLLEHAGRPIGPYDLLIAATAVANSRTLVTANTGEFSRAAGQTIENWETVAD